MLNIFLPVLNTGKYGAKPQAQTKWWVTFPYRMVNIFYSIIDEDTNWIVKSAAN